MLQGMVPFLDFLTFLYFPLSVDQESVKGDVMGLELLQMDVGWGNREFHGMVKKEKKVAGGVCV